MFKKIVLWSTIAFLSFFVFIAIMILSHYNDLSSDAKDCAVVFGAAVWGVDTPSHALRDRTMSAVELYHNNTVECIVLSGGASKFGAHEVAVMQQIVLDNGVPNDTLLLDRDGYNTRATVANLDPALSYILVSNDFHLARINLFAKRFDLSDHSLHASDYLSGRYQKELQFFLREMIAIPYYFFNIDRYL